MFVVDNPLEGETAIGPGNRLDDFAHRLAKQIAGILPAAYPELP